MSPLPPSPPPETLPARDPVPARRHGPVLDGAVALTTGWAFASPAGPVAYAADTIGQGHTSSIVTAGPATDGAMPGGFGGMDPSPALEQFQEYVREGRIHYFIAGEEGTPGLPGGSGMNTGSGAEISSWVQENHTNVTEDGVTLYDLTAPTT
jgi:hypothetical protein